MDIRDFTNINTKIDSKQKLQTFSDDTQKNIINNEINKRFINSHTFNDNIQCNQKNNTSMSDKLCDRVFECQEKKYNKYEYDINGRIINKN